MKTLIADTYEKGLHFEVLAENISSLKNISIEEQGDSNIYRFTVPASLLPQLFHCVFDFMDYLIPGRELEKPAEYEMELTADSSHKISNIKMAGDTGGDYPGRDEYDLDIVQLGGTIVVKHDILVPHDYRNIQLFTGYDYEEYRHEGCECSFVNGPVGIQVYLHPRDQLDRLGWSGHIGDYGNNILSKASVIKGQIVESDFQHVIAEYESADGYTAVFGLYDHLNDGFYHVMYIVDSRLIDKYRDEFLKYLKNVVW